MCLEKTLSRDRIVANDENKRVTTTRQTTKRESTTKAFVISPEPVAPGCSSTLELVSLSSAQEVAPIERFCQEYGEASGLLRERCMYEPHPRLNHAWIAAHIVDRFGLYHPCVSLKVDYANAVAQWEARQLKQSAEKQYKSSVCTSPDHPFHGEICCGRGMSLVEHARQLKEQLLEVAEETAISTSFHALAMARGFKAAQDIIAHRQRKEASAMRGKGLFDKIVAKSQHEAETDLLADYLEAKDIRADGNSEFLWDIVGHNGEAVAENDAEEGETATDTSSFEHVNGSYEVENGEPMVAWGGLSRFRQAILGY